MSQPDPTPNDHPAVWDLVMADMGARDAVGLARYGTRLQPHNGRDALRDAYDGADLHDAVDDFIDWVDDRVEYEIGDGPLANAAEALLETLDGPILRALAKQLIQGAARLPVNDRRHP